jgi:hypothetical protein
VTRLLFWLSACTFIAMSARAQSEAVRVQIVPCDAGAPAWDTQQMLEIVRVEISPRPLVMVDASAEGALLVDACDASRLVLRDQRSAPPVVREMPLDDVPAQLKPRVAALAVAELASGASLEAPEPEPAEPAKSRVAARRAAVRSRPPIDNEMPPKLESPKHTQPWLGLGPEGRVFLLEPGPNFGPRLTLALRRVELGLLALLGRQDVAAGTVSTGVVAAAADIPFWRARRARDVSIAAGAELGITWAKGKLRDSESDRARGQAAPFLAALVRLNWGGRVAQTAYAQVAWALGYAKGLNARVSEPRSDANQAIVVIDRQTVASTHGPFAAMSVTVAWAP